MDIRNPTARRACSRLLLASVALGALALAGCATPREGAPGAASSPAARGAKSVLVLGGTGQLGAEIVRRSVAAGHAVTVFARPTSDRSRLAGLPVEYVVGDLSSDADLARILGARRYDTVVAALRVEDGDIHFYEKNLGPLARGARAARVGQIIHHGAVGAGANAAKFTTLGWERVPGLLDRLKDQGVGEDLLRASGVPLTIIRNARIYPDGTPPTGHARLTTDDSVISPMTRADLALFTVQCIGNRDCHGKVWHVRDDSLAWPPPREGR